MDEDKWERYERERLQIQSETMAQLELLLKAFADDSVDEVVRLQIQSETMAQLELLLKAFADDSVDEVVRLLLQTALANPNVFITGRGNGGEFAVDLGQV